MFYLLEIGTEELPAGTTGQIAESLKNLFFTKLKEYTNLIPENNIELFSTPRRLAILIKDLPSQTESRQELIKGPAPSAVAQAIEGFAKKQNVKITDLFEEDGRLCFYKVIDSKPISEILKLAIEFSLKSLTAERFMTWGNGEHRFARPIRWIVSLLDSEIFDFELFGLKANRQTRPNRLLEADQNGFKFIDIQSAELYAQILRANLVEPSRAERKKSILSQIKNLEEKNNFEAYIDENLLEEIIDLLEWPTALIGSFEAEFLELPQTLIINVLKHHQRYLPCFKQKDKIKQTLLNATEAGLCSEFIFIANCLPAAQPNVIKGNQRVLRARLKDGEFFVKEDLKVQLENEKSQIKLDKMTFQKELKTLGQSSSMLGKVKRLNEMSKALAELMSLKPDQAEDLIKISNLSKYDLVSNLVFEFPELQGIAGGFIAKQQKEKSHIYSAVKDQYKPLFSGDDLPESLLGASISILDRIDNLICLFLLNKIPTGSGDPFALRRQSQGIFEILLANRENPLNLEIKQLFKKLYLSIWANEDGFEEIWAGNKSKKINLKEFLRHRLIFVLSQNTNLKKELLEIFMAENHDLDFNLKDLLAKVYAFEKVQANSDFQDSLMAIKRIFRIIKTEIHEPKPKPELFTENAEKNLWQSLNNWQIIIQKSEKFEDKWLSLNSLSLVINNFFEEVMIEDKNPETSMNRKELLSLLILSLREHFGNLNWEALQKV